jgi:hypothetical protein
MVQLQIPQPPPNVGRLLDAGEVATEIFNGKVTPAWVKANLKAGRTKLGHRTVVWAEYPARAWLERQVAT